jgi:WhiB family redox-sensing transcriptional regulator
MNKSAGIHPQPSPWRQPHDRGQPERASPWRDPDERVFLAAFWSWRLHAACRGVDTELFYSREDERRLTRAAREQAAKAICASCPVKTPCAAYALQHHERYGIWGGLTESERAYWWSQAAAAAHQGHQSLRRGRA